MQNTPKRGDKDFEPMRRNKTKIPLPTERERSIANFYTALKMISCFRYRAWMSNPDVTGPNGERINPQGQIFIPKRNLKRI